jgi:DNA-binding transcriptional LysR family regulator
VGTLPVRWIGPIGNAPITQPSNDEPLPLVAFEAPCLLRSTATTALDRAGIPWRIAFTSPSLSGIWAAVAAGLGIAVRTEIGLPRNLRALDPAIITLPSLPTLGLSLHRTEAKADTAVQRLWDIILRTLEQPAYQFAMRP